MKVVIVDTRNYEFVGLGHTEAEAIEAIKQRWSDWCDNVLEADRGYMQELIDGGDAQVIDLDPGKAVITGIDP